MRKLETIKIHIVDDSASVRKVLGDLLDTDSSLEVIDTSSDPIIAEKKLKKQWPDVFILDIEMPHKDGITFLKEIMATRPTPVVMCSSLTENNTKITMEALSAGAVEIISKPKVGLQNFLYESAMMLVDVIKSAALADVKTLKKTISAKPGLKVSPKLTADALLTPFDGKRVTCKTDKIVTIGASAGGTQALEALLSSLPLNSPGIIIVQHMPEKFTFAFAKRLNNICAIEVKEAEDNDQVKSGRALIAPGNLHLMVIRKGSNYSVITKEGPLVSRHRPAVDVLFRSVAKNGGENVLGVILTGMGDDGAAGMFEMKQAGSRTIAQNEETCVVFGMPKEAIKRGGVDEVLPLEDISGEIIKFAVN